MLVLACWIYTVGKSSEGLIVSAVIDQTDDTSIDQMPTFELEPSADESVPQVSEPVVSMDLEIRLDDLSSIEPAQEITTLTSASLQNASPISGGKQRGASFFGTYAQGNQFVYVLDSSTSMLEGDRWTYACNQLIDSLRQLRADQEFFVICFDFETKFVLKSSPKYFKAEKTTVNKVRQWLRSVELGPNTLPMAALFSAMRLNPDAIFLLTDGKLRDDSENWLKLNNGANERRLIPIHTFYLYSEPTRNQRGLQALELMVARETLQEIAAHSGGTFKEIECQRTFRARKRR